MFWLHNPSFQTLGLSFRENITGNRCLGIFLCLCVHFRTIQLKPMFIIIFSTHLGTQICLETKLYNIVNPLNLEFCRFKYFFLTAWSFPSFKLYFPHSSHYHKKCFCSGKIEFSTKIFFFTFSPPHSSAVFSCQVNHQVCPSSRF